MLQHADTRSISNPQTNVDVVGVLKTLGLGVSQGEKAKHLSSVLCRCLFIIRGNTTSCVCYKRSQWAKEGHGWKNEGTTKGWGFGGVASEMR